MNKSDIRRAFIDAGKFDLRVPADRDALDKVVDRTYRWYQHPLQPYVGNAHIKDLLRGLAVSKDPKECLRRVLNGCTAHLSGDGARELAAIFTKQLIVKDGVNVGYYRPSNLITEEEPPQYVESIIVIDFQASSSGQLFIELQTRLVNFMAEVKGGVILVDEFRGSDPVKTCILQSCRDTQTVDVRKVAETVTSDAQLQSFLKDFS